MNKQYQELFQLVARNGALNAERALETLMKEDGKDSEAQILIEMRDRFGKLEDKIMNGEELIINDYIQLYAGAMVSRNIIQKNVEKWSAMVHEYDENLIPKLYEVAKETNDENRASLVDEYFN